MLQYIILWNILNSYFILSPIISLFNFHVIAGQISFTNTDDDFIVLFHWRIYYYPSGIYLLKVNSRNVRTRCEICSKLTLKTPERGQWRCSFSSVSFVTFEHLITGWTLYCFCSDKTCAMTHYYFCIKNRKWSDTLQKSYSEYCKNFEFSKFSILSKNSRISAN